MMGIYAIVNNVNGHKYVGLSTNVYQRFMEHKTPGRIANGKTVLAKAFRKYPMESFSFEILESIEDGNLLSSREEYWIEFLKPEYNMNKGGLGNKGWRVSDETKKKISKTAKKWWSNQPEEFKQSVIKNNLTGPKTKYVPSEDTKEKLRQINLGKKHSKETKQKMSEKQKVSMLGNQNGNKKIASFKDGELIKIYKSTKAAADEMGVSPCCVTGVLKGRRKTTAGYSWRYWSVETNRDECNGVGASKNHVSKREASQVDEDIVQPLAIEKLRIVDKGFIQLAIRSGKYKTINAAPIYEGELVSTNKMSGEIVLDETKKTGDTVIGYASYFKLLDGFEKQMYMTVKELDDHGQRFSKSYSKGLWKSDPHSMMMKTVIKLILSKYGPLSTEMQRAVAADQSVISETEDGIKYDYVDNPETQEVPAEEIPVEDISQEEIDWESPDSIIEVINKLYIESLPGQKIIGLVNEFKKQNKSRLECFSGPDEEKIKLAIEAIEKKALGKK